MFLKVMSDEHHLKDSDPAKNFSMIEIPKGHRLFFKKDESYPEGDPHKIALIGPWAGLEGTCEPWPIEMQSQVVAIPSTAYVISDDGNTIARQSSIDPNKNYAVDEAEPIALGLAAERMIGTRKDYNRYRELSARPAIELDDDKLNELLELRRRLRLS